MTRYRDYYIGISYVSPRATGYPGWRYIVCDEAGDIIQRSTVFLDKSIALRAACLWIDAVLVEGAGKLLPRWTDAKSLLLDDGGWACRIFTSRSEAPQVGDIVQVTSSAGLVRILEVLEIKPNGRQKLTHICRTEVCADKEQEGKNDE